MIDLTELSRKYLENQVIPPDTIKGIANYQKVLDNLVPTAIHTKAQEEFDAWVAGKKVENLSPVDLGKKLYTTRNCNSCHSVDGSKIIGPSFKG